MIQTTNNAKEFFEKNNEPIYIYGVGNPGYWVTYYMQKCNIRYEGYIDKAVTTDDCYMSGKRIIHPKELKAYTNGKIRVIVAIGKPEEAVEELHWNADKNDILCLVPFYLDHNRRCKQYDINKMLSYFRRKLIAGDPPAFISNSCDAGWAYRGLGLNLASPTIDVAISPEDFLKMCKAPHEYLECEMSFSNWTLFLNGMRRPVGKVNDIEVVFGHSDNAEESIMYWNRLKDAINWNNLIYIMDDAWRNVSYQVAKEFCNLPVKHLLLLRNSMYSDCNMNGMIYVNHGHFHLREVAIENWFDLVGWVNGEFEL